MPFASMAGMNALAPPTVVSAGSWAGATPASMGAKVGDLLFFDVYGGVSGGSGVVQVADTIYAFITSSNINSTFTGSIASYFILRGVRAVKIQSASGFVKTPNYIGIVTMTVTPSNTITTAKAGGIAMTQRAFYSGNNVFKYYYSLFRPNQPSDYVDTTPFTSTYSSGAGPTPSQVVELLG